MYGTLNNYPVLEKKHNEQTKTKVSEIRLYMSIVSKLTKDKLDLESELEETQLKLEQCQLSNGRPLR